MGIRKVLFWLHLCVGVTSGIFIFIMAATGVMLSFERQITDWVDRDIRSVTIPSEAQAQPVSDLLEELRHAGMGDPTAIVLRNEPHAATQFSIGRGKTVYIDPYSGAVLGSSSSTAHDFFFGVERLHRAMGAPLGSRTIGRWLSGISNLLFGALILLGIILWLPRRWNWKSVRASIAFRRGLRGRAREWNWHNVLGIWCALPLLVIVLTGVVMSFDWANALLFRLSGSPVPTRGRDAGEKPAHERSAATGREPDYDRLFAVAKSFDPRWRTITMNVSHNTSAPVTAEIDTGTGGQPQKRTRYSLNPETGNILKTTAFVDGSLGRRLRAFVRFGHTGEYYGVAGQAIAAFASLGACVLAYTGIALSIRRLNARLKRKRNATSPKIPAEQIVA